jgi:hypothetical protein
VQLIIQGMRRSGTTIAFDLFWNLPGTVCLYEPLAPMHDAAYGGGSGQRNVDLFSPVRRVRKEFVARTDVEAELNDFNVGAPARPWLETGPEGPADLERYLRFAGEQGDPDVVMKFTRLAPKMGLAHQALADARVLHVVRDPRRVVRSFLLGRDGKRAHKYPSVEDFFNQRTRRLPWSATALSDAVMERYPEYRVSYPSDAERILLLWKFNFVMTHRVGRERFGERYLMVRHEDLASEPEGTTERIWGWLGAEVPADVRDWAKRYVRAPEQPLVQHDPRWAEMVRRLALYEELTEAGYGQIVMEG